jgi:hypothetical protein
MKGSQNAPHPTTTRTNNSKIRLTTSPTASQAVTPTSSVRSSRFPLFALPRPGARLRPPPWACRRTPILPRCLSALQSGLAAAHSCNGPCWTRHRVACLLT